MAGALAIKKFPAIYILCIASFFASAFYNELNLRKVPPENIRYGVTIITNDDASYLNPPREYLNKGIWGEDYWGGDIGRFIRPPGYGLLYLPFLKIFGETSSITALKIFQYLLFSFSVFWFYSIVLLLIKKHKIALISAFFYGCSPFVIGFLSYTLTESVTPALMLCYLCLLCKGLNSEEMKLKNRYYFAAACVFAFLFIVRPVLGIFMIFLPVFILYDLRNYSLKVFLPRLIIFSSVACSLMLAWQIRNYNITGRYVGLHPIYYEDGNTIYREPFREYWNFAGCWAERGDVGFSYMVPLWEAAIAGDTSRGHVDYAIEHLPADVRNYFGKERLFNVFRDYQWAVLYQKPFYDQQRAMPMERAVVEERSVQGFRALTADYKKEFPFQYYVLSPLKVFKLLAFHSNLSLYIFQKTYRGQPWMEQLRMFCYLLHVSCFLLIFFNMFYLRRNLFDSLIFGWIPFMYVFYLCYVQRGIEERYTLPVLPWLVIGLVVTVYSIYSRKILSLR
jgi:hypothetical protein